ncbi:MAG: hypothetical protein DMG63_09165 [Acidobacteria bacterium]|nr:MAG: hypothetical protein DMG63_09165 [Acidobacteriota bacterium]
MFTRVVQVTTKSGKAREVCNTIRDKALPILKNQNGFVDEFTLVSTNDPNRVLAISFWKTREDAQQYHRGSRVRSASGSRHPGTLQRALANSLLIRCSSLFPLRILQVFGGIR